MGPKAEMNVIEHRDVFCHFSCYIVRLFTMGSLIVGGAMLRLLRFRSVSFRGEARQRKNDEDQINGLDLDHLFPFNPLFWR